MEKGAGSHGRGGRKGRAGVDLAGTAILRPSDLRAGDRRRRPHRRRDWRGAQRAQLRGRLGEGAGSPSRPVPGLPPPGPRGAPIGRQDSARRAHWPAGVRSTRPPWRARSRRVADQPTDRGLRGRRARAWWVRGCGWPLGAGCRARATAGREPPRPRPPALAAARRVPAPTALAPRALRPPRHPRAAPSSAPTCGLVTKTCGDWCTVGEPEWNGRRRGGAPCGCRRAPEHRPRAVGVLLFGVVAPGGLSGTPKAGPPFRRGSAGSSRGPLGAPRRPKPTGRRFVRRLRLRELGVPEAAARV